MASKLFRCSSRLASPDGRAWTCQKVPGRADPRFPQAFGGRSQTLLSQKPLTIIIIHLQNLGDPIVNLLIILLCLAPQAELVAGGAFGFLAEGFDLLDTVGRGRVGAVQVVGTTTEDGGTQGGDEEARGATGFALLKRRRQAEAEAERKEFDDRFV